MLFATSFLGGSQRKFWRKDSGWKNSRWLFHDLSLMWFWFGVLSLRRNSSKLCEINFITTCKIKKTWKQLYMLILVNPAPRISWNSIRTLIQRLLVRSNLFTCWHMSLKFKTNHQNDSSAKNPIEYTGLRQGLRYILVSLWVIVVLNRRGAASSSYHIYSHMLSENVHHTYNTFESRSLYVYEWAERGQTNK